MPFVCCFTMRAHAHAYCHRYKFPGKKWIDAAVDLPFALPTSVAGLTLATVYR